MYNLRTSVVFTIISRGLLQIGFFSFFSAYDKATLPESDTVYKSLQGVQIIVEGNVAT